MKAGHLDFLQRPIAFVNGPLVSRKSFFIPRASTRRLTVQQEEQGTLLGKTGVTITSLRPRGDALIDGGKHPVVSFDGSWIDADSRIEVKTYRNGLPCVALLAPAEGCKPTKC